MKLTSFSLWQIRVGVLLGLVSILAGCSTTTKTLDPGQVTSIKRVGVISLLPSDLLYQKIGITVFNNERSVRPVGGFLNDAARNGVEAALEKIQRIKVKQLEVDLETMRRNFRPGAIVFSWPPAPAKQALIELARHNDLDGIVVISEVFDSDNGYSGVKFFLRAGLGNIEVAGMRSDIETTIYSAQGETLISRNVGLGILHTLARPDMKPWAYRLDENLDASTHQYVVSSMQKLIHSSVFRSVQVMGL